MEIITKDQKPCSGLKMLQQIKNEECVERAVYRMHMTGGLPKLEAITIESPKLKRKWRGTYKQKEQRIHSPWDSYKR